MATACNMVIGISLVVLLAMLVCMCLAGVWRHLTRQLTRSGLVVFLIGAGIATIEAQKIRQKDLYVDASAPQSGSGCSADSPFKTIQEAIDSVGMHDTTIHVRPGVYGPCEGDNTCLFYEAIPYRYRVVAEEGPAKTFIDGQGVGPAVSYIFNEPPEWCGTWCGFTLTNATFGGRNGRYENCLVTGCGLGLWQAEAENCLIVGNSGSGAYGGGADESVLYNCTVVGNVMKPGDWWIDDVSAGLSRSCLAYNCIVLGNTVDGVPSNYLDNSFYECMLVGCCTYPVPGRGTGNIDVDPLFVDSERGDFHLRMGSPCINAGTNDFVFMLQDYDGNPRIQRGRVDIGCYEYQPTNEHQTITAPVPVEFAWIDEKCPEVLAACGGDYDRAVLMKSENPVDISLPEPMRTYYSIWESYVADLDPTDSNRTFRATIEMVDGEPVVKGDPESPNRKYTVLGKEELSDETWQENLPGAKFFKVKVGLQ